MALETSGTGLAAGGGMAGKTVVMTGATSGLGAVAAEALASRGARLVIVARDAGRAADTVSRLRRANPATEPGVHLADLSRLAEMKRVAAEIAAAEPRIDVLANNAGALFAERSVTEDGMERTFATNHLAYMVLTLGLAAPLAATAGARVVNTSSGAHRSAHYDHDDVQSLNHFLGWRAYARSKLYNILFTRELARRWRARDVTVNCFHPGFVATRFGDASGGFLGAGIAIGKLFAISPQKGARTLIHLASAPEVAGVTGGYFVKSAPAEPTRAARDDEDAAVLWEESIALAGIEGRI